METFTHRITRTARELRMVTWGLLDTGHPILAQIVPMRRCNLACAYCNEYDKTSDPVPLATMLRRIDRLGELRTGIVTLSGGEPMMHPELDDIIRRTRDRGMLAGLITNGFYLGPERIERLNDAGLEYLQISIDNVMPDEVSQKSLKTLDKKLEHLAAHARFHVNINSVVGAGMKNPEDALTIAGAPPSSASRRRSASCTTRAASSRRSTSARRRSTTSACASARGCTRASTTSSATSSRGVPTPGSAAPARATSTSARTAWCTTARSSAAFPRSRSSSTRPRTSAASTRRPRRARPIAPSAACIAPPRSTTSTGNRSSSCGRSRGRASL